MDNDNNDNNDNIDIDKDKKSFTPKTIFWMIIKNILFICVFVSVFFGIQKLLMPKYMSSVYEGALIAEYYDEALPHDVIFIGNCEMYTNISPVTLWEHYGISSYIRGGPNQLIWQSYYLLEDTLRYEKPSAVVFNVITMQDDKPEREEYNRLNIDGMRFSPSKISSAKASAVNGESLLSYIFPLFRYHDRWSELHADDFRYYFSRDKVSINGYMMRCDVKPVGIIPAGKKLPDYRFSEITYKYLDMITELCKNNGIELILIKTPVIFPHWYEQWDEQMTDYAKENELIYINFLDLTDEIGIDFSTDTYSAGLNLNVYGAEKFSLYLGKILSDHTTDKRSDLEYAAVWDEKIQMYNWLKEQQEREFYEHGKISTIKIPG